MGKKLCSSRKCFRWEEEEEVERRGPTGERDVSRSPLGGAANTHGNPDNDNSNNMKKNIEVTVNSQIEFIKQIE